MWYGGEANKDQGCTKAGLRGTMALCMSDTYFLWVIDIIAELRGDKALAIAMACCSPASGRICPPCEKGYAFR